MFNLFKRKSGKSGIRDALFGDLPISRWPSEGVTPDSEPWLSFVIARECLDSGRTQEAIHLFQAILAMPGLESRHYVQAWHFLREAGVMPETSIAKEVYGVVGEVTMRRGLDIVAAYADGNARYFSYVGGAIVWNAPDDSLYPQIESVLQAGKIVVEKIGPWEAQRPAVPPLGEARVNILTPSGLHFGQAPLKVLAADQLGSIVMSAVTELKQSLIAKTKEKKT